MLAPRAGLAADPRNWPLLRLVFRLLRPTASDTGEVGRRLGATSMEDRLDRSCPRSHQVLVCVQPREAMVSLSPPVMCGQTLAKP